MKMQFPSFQGSDEDVAREWGFDASKLRAWLRRANRDLRRYFEREKEKAPAVTGAKKNLANCEETTTRTNPRQG
jgi:hypothetical protein